MLNADKINLVSVESAFPAHLRAMAAVLHLLTAMNVRTALSNQDQFAKEDAKMGNTLTIEDDSAFLALSLVLLAHLQVTAPPA